MNSPNQQVISVKDLKKVYKGGFEALKGVSLNIKQGEIFGLLGPNGAGKTTLIGILTGLVNKTSGEALILGKDVEKDYKFTKSKIGLVQQEINADFFFTIEEMLINQGGYFGIPKDEIPLEEILRDLNLLDKKDTPGRMLSGGMKRRVMIAKALVHDPEILFLDEPTAGVDIELRENLWDLVEKLKSRNRTIILTTHYLEEAEQLADRIGIINSGELIRVENKKDLLSDPSKNLNAVYKEILNSHK